MVSAVGAVRAVSNVRAVSARRSRAYHAIGAVASVAATLVLTSSASAAMPAASARHVTASPRSSGRTMATLFGMIRIYATPDTHGQVKGKITTAATMVSVTCWTTGTNYKNISIWYQVADPIAGYIPAFNLAAHFSPAARVPHCLLPSFKLRYYSIEPSLHIRTSPSISASISGLLGSTGSRVVITCFTTGSAVFGDPIWYHTQSPAVGYVSGRLLNTGGDPAPGTPRC